MKIALMVDDTLDKPDGVQQYVLSIGTWLQAQGHEVHYIAGATKRTDLPHLHALAKNVQVRFNGNTLSIPLPVSRRRIRRLLHDEQFDVIHVQTPHSPFYAHRVVLEAPQQTACVATFHILPHSRFAASMTRLLGFWLRASLRRMQTIMAVSDAAADFARQSFGVKVQTVPNAIDLTPFFAAIPKPDLMDKPTVVFLNRLVERKGAQYLLQAVNHLVHMEQFDRPFRVLICGKGELRTQLESYVAAHNLGDHVEFAGYVDEADKPGILASAALTVYPSTGGESFGIVLIEALAASPGPVLAGNNPGYASVMQPFPSQLFDPKDIPAFAELLKEHLQSTPDSSAPAQREYARQFDISAVGPQLEQIYNESLRQVRNVR